MSQNERRPDEEPTAERKPSPPRKPTTSESVAVRSLRSGTFASRPDTAALGITGNTARTSSGENRPANVSPDATMPETEHSQLSKRSREKAREQHDD